MTQRKKVQEQRVMDTNGIIQEYKSKIADAVHDLKAPLGSVRALVECLKIDDLKKEEMRRYVEIAESSIEEMQARLEELQKITADSQQRLQMERTCINFFLTSIYQSYLPDARANGIYLSMDLPQREYYLNFDRRQMTKAVENIIVNALDFTPPQGEISLILTGDEKLIQVKVKDTGKGIPQEEQEQIFDRKFSLRSKQEPKGSGLGLYITKEIIEAHGGKIMVESQPGNGTTFTISFIEKQRDIGGQNEYHKNERRRETNN